MKTAMASKETLAESKELFSNTTSVAQVIFTNNEASNTTVIGQKNNVSSKFIDNRWQTNAAAT